MTDTITSRDPQNVKITYNGKRQTPKDVIISIAEQVLHEIETTSSSTHVPAFPEFRDVVVQVSARCQSPDFNVHRASTGTALRAVADTLDFQFRSTSLTTSSDLSARQARQRQARQRQARQRQARQRQARQRQARQRVLVVAQWLRLSWLSLSPTSGSSHGCRRQNCGGLDIGVEKMGLGKAKTMPITSAEKEVLFDVTVRFIHDSLNPLKYPRSADTKLHAANIAFAATRRAFEQAFDRPDFIHDRPSSFESIVEVCTKPLIYMRNGVYAAVPAFYQQIDKSKRKARDIPPRRGHQEPSFALV